MPSQTFSNQWIGNQKKSLKWVIIVIIMYNLVSCYDSLEMKVRGDVLSDKVYLSDTDMNMDMDTDGLKLSQSESILTDMTHVISPMYEHSCTMGGKSPILSIGIAASIYPL